MGDFSQKPEFLKIGQLWHWLGYFRLVSKGFLQPVTGLDFDWPFRLALHSSIHHFRPESNPMIFYIIGPFPADRLDTLLGVVGRVSLLRRVSRFGVRRCVRLT